MSERSWTNLFTSALFLQLYNTVTELETFPAWSHNEEILPSMCSFWCHRVPHQGPEVPGAAEMLGQGLWGCRKSRTLGMPLYLAHMQGRSLSCPWVRCHSHASHSARPPSTLSRSPRRAACPCSWWQKQNTVRVCCSGCACGAVVCHAVSPHTVPPH